ncbi:MAG: hypothetical protein HPY74_04755 [Firmicutes bacterium]|nr:hypothetical protein [Bacillota bacterium]
MLSSKVCFSNSLLSDEKKICDTGKDLIQSKNFYILMERFCNIISKEDAQFDLFLNKYFNDEGYVDVWRIPYLLMDIYNCNFKFHSKTLDSYEFKSYFTRFLGLFYNYCLSEYKPYLIDEHNLNEEKRTVLQIKTNQHLMNIVMDTYSRIIENLESYKRAE